MSTTRRPSDHPLLASFFWREPKKCWTATYDNEKGSGKGQKLVPRDFKKSMEAQGRAWINEWLAAEAAKATGAPLAHRPRVPGILVKDAFEKWRDEIRAKDRKITPATRRANAEQFKNHVLPTFGEWTVAEVATDYSALRSWVRALIPKLSPVRVRNVFSTFRLFLDDAILEKWMRGENPLRNAGLVREQPQLPRKKDEDTVVVPVDWVQALIRGVDKNGERRVTLGRRTRYALAFTSGLREGELCGLTVGAIHVDDVVPYLEVAQARRLEREEDEELGATKTSTAFRRLPLHPAAIAALREWLSAEDGIVFWLGCEPAAGHPLFPTEQIRKDPERSLFARPDSAEKLRKDLAALGLPTTVAGVRVTMKASRSSFGTYIDRVDDNEETAEVREMDRKRLMGHGLDVTGKHYTVANMKRLSALVSAIPLAWPLTLSLPVSLTQVSEFEETSSRLGDLNPRPAVYESATGQCEERPAACSATAECVRFSTSPAVETRSAVNAKPALSARVSDALTLRAALVELIAEIAKPPAHRPLDIAFCDDADAVGHDAG